MKAMDTIQFRVPHQVKTDFAARCEQEGKSISEGARTVLEDYLYGDKDPLDELDDISADADRKLDAAGLPEPTIEEISEYCAKIRADRSSEMLAG